MQATSKLHSPLPSPDRPLLRVCGRYMSDYAAMATMNIQITFVIVHIKCVQNYNKFEVKGLNMAQIRNLHNNTYTINLESISSSSVLKNGGSLQNRWFYTSHHRCIEVAFSW